jgi:hypothetical protein
MPTEVNPTISETHSLLIRRVKALSETLSETTDEEIADAILLEMQECVHRISLLQSLMFTAASDRLDKQLAAVNEADVALANATKSIEKKAHFVRAATSLLTVVDKVIDIAKML